MEKRMAGGVDDILYLRVKVNFFAESLELWNQLPIIAKEC